MVLSGMRIWLVFFAVLWIARPAVGDVRADLKAKTNAAYEAYDGFEYEEARKLLNSALTIAKRQRIENSPEVARIHLALGIVYFGGLKDDESAKLSFLSAIQIDPTVEIDPAYRTPAMARLLADARVEAKAIADGGAADTTKPTPDVIVTPPPDAVDESCPSGAELAHRTIDTIRSGEGVFFRVQTGRSLRADSVAVLVRVKGAEDYARLPMIQDGCNWRVELPASFTLGDVLHYYVEARKEGEVVGRVGSPSLPNLVEIEGRTTTFATAPSQMGRVFLSVAYAAGGSYLSTSHTTEQGNRVDCAFPQCFSAAYAAFVPELSLRVGRRGRVGLAARIGLPVGANIPGHSTLFPSGFVKYHHHLREDGRGLGFSGLLGAGIIGGVIAMQPPSLDKDIVNLGPVLLGIGGTYGVGVGRSLTLVFSLDAILGLATSEKVGTARVNTALHFDAGVGLRLGI